MFLVSQIYYEYVFWKDFWLFFFLFTGHIFLAITMNGAFLFLLLLLLFFYM